MHGRWTGRIEHRAGALRKSPTDTLDRISRGDGVEGMSTSKARQHQFLQGEPPMLQSLCSCPFTPSPRLIRSKMSVGDLQRAPARCAIRPVHRPKTQVAACSRGDAPHGLFVTSPCRAGKPSQHAVRGFGGRRRPVELPFAPAPSCTAQPGAHGSKFQLHPSSWARAVPSLRLRLAPYGRSGSICCN